jgi:CBS domain-containing protein
MMKGAQHRRLFVLNLPKVSEYMDTVVQTLNAETQILDAVDFLLENHVTGAPVVDGDYRVVGILTEKDCLYLLAAGSDADMPQGVVADFMTHDVKTIPPSMNVYFCAGLFMNTVVRRFPVVDDGKLVGAITRFDILRAIQKNLR